MSVSDKMYKQTFIALSDAEKNNRILRLENDALRTNQARLIEDGERLAKAIRDLSAYCEKSKFYGDMGLSLTITQIEEVELAKHTALLTELAAPAKESDNKTGGKG